MKSDMTTSWRIWMTRTTWSLKRASCRTSRFAWIRYLLHPSYLRSVTHRFGRTLTKRSCSWTSRNPNRIIPSYFALNLRPTPKTQSQPVPISYQSLQRIRRTRPWMCLVFHRLLHRFASWFHQYLAVESSPTASLDNPPFLPMNTATCEEIHYR